MVSGEDWVDVGSTDVLARTPLKSCKARAIPIAVSFKDGQFGAVSNICNHVGGPLGEGRLDGDYITCPWHGWKFIASPAWASLDLKRIACQRSPSRSRAAAYSSTSRRRRGVQKRRTNRIRSRANPSVRR